MKTIKNNKRIDFYIELKGNKLYLVSAENNPIQQRIDITSVWNFFKDVKNYPPNKELLVTLKR